MNAPALAADLLLLDQPPVPAPPIKSRRRLRDPLASAGRVATRHRARRVRERTERERQEWERVRGEAIGLIDHHLRTPMTSVVGYTELVLDGDVGSLNEAQQRMLERVADNAAVLMGLMQALMHVSSDWATQGRGVDVFELAGHVIGEWDATTTDAAPAPEDPLSTLTV